jgi:hypothetical protein
VTDEPNRYSLYKRQVDTLKLSLPWAFSLAFTDQLYGGGGGGRQINTTTLQQPVMETTFPPKYSNINVNMNMLVNMYMNVNVNMKENMNVNIDMDTE